jgi:hypothetical protein
MKELLDFFQGAPIILIALVVIAYFLKLFIEKKVESLASRSEKRAEAQEIKAAKRTERLENRMDEIAKVSLDMKKDLRGEERGELVNFRVAVEKWEDYLQTLLFDFSMLPPSQADVASLYRQDKVLYLDVKIAVVKASTYLRKKDLELRLMAAVTKIRQTYYPMISESLPVLIDLQTKLIPLENKLKQFEQSGMKDMQFAPTTEDRETQLAMQTQMTAEMTKFSGNLLKEYRSIAEQMNELKEEINLYIYRPIHQAALDEE